MQEGVMRAPVSPYLGFFRHVGAVAMTADVVHVYVYVGRTKSRIALVGYGCDFDLYPDGKHKKFSMPTT